METILHENIFVSPEVAARYPDLDAILFYRDMFGCNRTLQPDGYKKFCAAAINGNPSVRVSISEDGIKATIMQVNGLTVRSCEACRYVPKK